MHEVPEAMRDSRRNAVLCMVISLFTFGSVPLFIKYFSSMLDAWTVNGIRYSVASLVLLPSVFSLLRADPGRRGVWLAAAIPAAANLLGQILWALTPYYNDASVIAFVIRSSFLFTLLFGFAVLPAERYLMRVPAFWTGSAICVAGVVTMYGAALCKLGGSTAFGVGLILITSVFWGIYAVAVKRLLSRYPARLSFGVVSLYTSVGLFGLMLAKGDLSRVSGLGIGNSVLLVVSGLIGISLSHVLNYRVIRVLGPVTASGVSLLMPFISWIGAAVLLGERMTALQWAGGVTLLAGTFLLVRAQSRAAGARPNGA